MSSSAKRTAALLVIGLCAFIAARSCESSTPPRKEMPPGGAPQPAHPLAGTPARHPTLVSREIKSACPAGMLEVRGSYCTELEHLCIEGHETKVVQKIVGGVSKKIGVAVPVHCPNGCAVPHYCDVFLKGHAVCTGEEKPEHFCIDDYEYPNAPGALPRVMVTWIDAKKTCEAEGKRLCGDDEWTLACEGPERFPYPTGWVRDNKACNIDVWTPMVNENRLFSSNKDIAAAEFRRLDHRTANGARPGCASAYGVHDLTGNVDEWTTNATMPGASFTAIPYVSVLKGGHWIANFPRNRCRPSTPGHAPYFYSYAQGFRCCADPK